MEPLDVGAYLPRGARKDLYDSFRRHKRLWKIQMVGLYNAVNPGAVKDTEYYIRTHLEKEKPQGVDELNQVLARLLTLALALALSWAVVIGGTALTGYMMTTDAYWGVEWVEELHELLANLAIALVGLHVLGVVFASIEHGENLVRAMVTGIKDPQ